METDVTSIAISRSTMKGRWTGRILSGIAVLFMTFDAVLHIANPAPVTQAFAQLDFPVALSATIGVVALACVVLYLVPRTSFIGALLLTAYLGGATAIQVRASAGLFPVIFPAIVATLLWASLVLRRDDI